jgi:hypothetical protein
MIGKRRWHLGEALGTALLTLLSGCGVGGYNTYATPRTTPKGRTQGAVFTQGVGFAGEIGKTSRRVILPVLPSFGMRLGLADDVDMGTHLSMTPGTFEAGAAIEFATDLRYQIVHGHALELAIDPGVTVAQVAGVAVSDARGYQHDQDIAFWTFDAPLVTGVNLSNSVAIVLTTGILYGLRAPDAEPDWAAINGRWLGGFAPRVGLGLHDDSGRFAFHPEGTLAFATRGGERRVIYTLGVAFEIRWWKPHEKP